jgi:hypothetical protein
MNIYNLETLYTDINNEIQQTKEAIKNNKDVKKVKNLDTKLANLNSASKSLEKLMNYYKFIKNI